MGLTAVVACGKFWSGVRLQVVCGVWEQTDAHITCQAAAGLQPVFVVVVLLLKVGAMLVVVVANG